MRLIALVLIVAGVLALVYGGFSYTKDTQHTKLGPIEFTVKDQERVNRAGVGRRRRDCDRHRTTAAARQEIIGVTK